MRTIEELRMKQSLPLNIKVMMTKERIRQWVNEFGEDGVYVSFSGGKDSTVLLHLVREMYPDVPAVFSDTGLEYPEIRGFVKTFDNVVWLKPKMNFKQVIDKYGYPFISKEVSGTIDEVNAWLSNSVGYRGGGKEKAILEQYENSSPDSKYECGIPVKALQLLGRVPHKEHGVRTDEYSKMYNKSKWMFLIDAPFPVSQMCCKVMKKQPMNKYAKESGRKPITGQMTDESILRTSQWLKYGCNMFESKVPKSNPMSFWTNQDVLQYIKQNDIEICSIYGDIVEDTEIDGQMNIADFIEAEAPKLKTTGCDRTGCMFCGYGCHLEKGEGRFERMKKTHPKQYDYIMRPKEQGGLDYKNVIDWLNEHGNLKIKY